MSFGCPSVVSSKPVSILWILFLLLWAGTQLFYGAVRPGAIAITALGISSLYIVTGWVFPGEHRFSRGTGYFLLGVSLLFGISFLPVSSFLFPFTHHLRESHGMEGLWPATADTFLTLRSFVQFWVYVLAGFLTHRLLKAGLSSQQVLKGIVFVLGIQLLYATVSFLAGFHYVPFFGESAYPEAATGTLVNRNSFAGLAGMGLIAVAALGFSSPRRLDSRFAWGAIFVLFLVGIVLSKSRGGFLAAFAGLSVFVLFLRARKQVPSFLALFFLGSCAVLIANAGPLLDRFQSIDPYEIEAQTRWEYASTTVEGALHQPIFGFGFGTHPRAYHPFQPPTVRGQIQHAHNEYVNLFFESGFVGVLLFVGGLLFWFVRSTRGLRRLAGPMRTHAAAALGGVAVIVVHSMVDFDLRITSIGILFSVFLALGAYLTSSPTGTFGSGRWLFPLTGILGGLALLFLPLDPDPLVEEAKSGDRGKAEKLSSRALALSPYDFRAAWIRARASKDLETADQRLSVAAELWPAHPDLQREGGLWFWEAGKIEESARCFRRLFEQDPRSVLVVMKEIWDPTIPIASYAALLPETPLPVAMMAGFFVDQGHWREGVDLFNQRWNGDPAAADYFAHRLSQVGQWGLEAMVREWRLEKKSDRAAWVATGRAWLRLGRLDRALECAEMAIRIDPGSLEGWVLQGDIFVQASEKMKAIEAFTEALRLDPENISLRMKRGKIYFELKFYDLAAGDFREVLRLRPDAEEAFFYLQELDSKSR